MGRPSADVEKMAVFTVRVPRRVQTECMETETGGDVFTGREKPQEEEGSGGTSTLNGQAEGVEEATNATRQE